MKVLRSRPHLEENESYLETFLDVLLCGLGAALALLIVYSVLPKGGSALQRATQVEMLGQVRANTGVTNSTIENNAPVVVIDTWARAAENSSAASAVDTFKVVTESGAAIPNAEHYVTQQNVGPQFGFEHLCRFQPNQQTAALLVQSNLVSSGSEIVNATVFINGNAYTLSFQVLASTGQNQAFRIVPTPVLKRTAPFPLVSGYVPLVKVTPEGELIGLEPAKQ